MTFKHIKFDESEIMRSLEKLTLEKGLVKKASIIEKKKICISDNLIENILNLCAGLREAGFSKYANDLESKFLNYKKAQTLYETSKETGEDLIDSAHPDGSHKLEGVDGDCTIETILDTRLKMLDVINKKPTAKLASKDIINSVKTVLAGDFLSGTKYWLEHATGLIGRGAVGWSAGYFYKKLIGRLQMLKQRQENLIERLDFYSSGGSDGFKNYSEDLKIKLNKYYEMTQGILSKYSNSPLPKNITIDSASIDFISCITQGDELKKMVYDLKSKITDAEYRGKNSLPVLSIQLVTAKIDSYIESLNEIQLDLRNDKAKIIASLGAAAESGAIPSTTTSETPSTTSNVPFHAVHNQKSKINENQKSKINEVFGKFNNVNVKVSEKNEAWKTKSIAFLNRVLEKSNSGTALSDKEWQIVLRLEKNINSMKK